jgi:hypothetical protein
MIGKVIGMPEQLTKRTNQRGVTRHLGGLPSQADQGKIHVDSGTSQILRK